MIAHVYHFATDPCKSLSLSCNGYHTRELQGAENFSVIIEKGNGICFHLGFPTAMERELDRSVNLSLGQL